MRKDYEIFFKHIKPQSKVLDIGCGEGEFLEILKNVYSCHAYGIDIESERVASALSKGLSVVQGDADKELQFFPAKEVAPEAFDYAILANTLQAMKHPKETLEQARRVSKKTLVSIPNFGFYANRLQLLLKGKMPVTKQLSYEWYETPNIHFSTLTDFIVLVKKVGYNIDYSYYITDSGVPRRFSPSTPHMANLFGRTGVFVLS